MKIRTFWMSKNERYWYLAAWHEWFAWFPVRVADREFRWLETIYRKRVSKLGVGYRWEYGIRKEREGK